MDDIFYFTNERISLGHISNIAMDLGYLTRYFTFNSDSGSILNITYRGDTESNDFWEWHDMGNNQDGFDFPPEELERITASGAVSAFMVSFQRTSLEQLINFLKRLLEEYGGWIGGDTEDWEPVYTLMNIDGLWYPYFESDPAVLRAIYEATIRAKLKKAYENVSSDDARHKGGRAISDEE